MYPGLRLGAGALLLVALAAPSAALSPERHPSLLFETADLDLIEQRIARAPYRDWWDTILARANAVPAAPSTERDKARYAKSLAFAYLLTDSTYLLGLYG